MGAERRSVFQVGWMALSRALGHGNVAVGLCFLSNRKTEKKRSAKNSSIAAARKYRENDKTARIIIIFIKKSTINNPGKDNILLWIFCKYYFCFCDCGFHSHNASPRHHRKHISAAEQGGGRGKRQPRRSTSEAEELGPNDQESKG